MTQQIINVGNVANDGQGTPLRTAFQYINSNFTELYNGTGAAEISNGTSNVTVVSANGNITTNVNGTANVMVVSSTLVSITGDLSVSGNATLSGNILGDRIVNGTTELDIQVANGNANLTIGGTSNVVVWATTGEYVTGLISASGNITGGNLRTAGLISATGNIITGSGGSIGVGIATPDAEVTILANPQTVTYALTGNSTTSGTDLHIVGANSAITRITQDAFGTSTYVAFTGRTARGTAATPTQTQSTDILTQFTARGFSNGTLQFGNASTGRIDIVASENFTDTSRATDIQIFTTATGAITPTAIATFSSANGLSAVGNIAGGNILTAGIVKTTAKTYATLPTAANAGAGARSFITDGNTATFGSQVIAGGANAVPVWSNGTNWYVG